MKVIIGVPGANVLNKSFEKDGQNPGVGGTTFVSVMLGLSLAASRDDYEVLLWSDHEINLVDQSDNINCIRKEDSPFPNSHLFKDKNNIFISPESILSRYTKCDIRKSRCKIVNWIHHPFRIPSHRKINYHANVSVGIYQYYSNQRYYRSHWYISNIFNSTDQKKIIKPYNHKERLNIVFLGGLVPAKGFHHIIKSWPRITKLYPQSKFDVIGSFGTYSGEEIVNQSIPTTNSYAKQIMPYVVDRDIQEGRVIFHGNLGTGKLKILEKAHVALLNPTGISEAFPASVLECLMSSTPVIGSNDYGMSDTMRFFPELSLKHHNEIPSKLKWLLVNPKRYAEIQQRAVNVSNYYSRQSTESILRWQQLIDQLNDGCIINNRAPNQSLVGNPLRMSYRHLKYEIKNMLER